MPCEDFRVLEVPVPGLDAVRTVLGNPGNDESALDTTAVTSEGSSKSSPNLARRLLKVMQDQYGVFNLCRLPDKHDLWAWRGLSKIAGEKWDAVVTTGGPYSVHIVGYSLKRRGITDRWGLDWRDLWTDNHIYPGLPVVRWLERYVERIFHQKADVITTVSEPLASVLRAKVGDKVEVIYNGFDPEDYENLPRERIFPQDGVFRIVYTGTIYPGKQDPKPLFAAIRMLAAEGRVNPDELQVVLAGRNADVTATARREGVADYVKYAGFVPRQNALRMQRDADALLFIEFNAPGVKGILTGKLFEYLFAGPPVIAVGICENSIAGQVIEETGRGFTYGEDAEALANGLEHILCSGDFQLNKNYSLSSSAQRFSRSEQAVNLLALIES